MHAPHPKSGHLHAFRKKWNSDKYSAFTANSHPGKDIATICSPSGHDSRKGGVFIFADSQTGLISVTVERKYNFLISVSFCVTCKRKKNERLL
ncbi:hypothetical protein CEXT_234331 [Caerostris extrusa]|uniref:Uncharacterized protein n=1 Tax=Caerostris extrusa TaxID=172846 RepID=A0AAV4QYM9_CAEEX|nr:hypothetical protein CEXT_234331 [Caerostris extrusa]